MLDGLRWRKTMRWNASNLGYPRPLRWIVARYGDQLVPFSWADTPSGGMSRGPRFADAAADLPAGEFTTFAVPDSASYFDQVAAKGIVIDREERRQLVQQQVNQAAAEVNGVTPDDPDLLDEVTDLIEAPTALLGRFEEKYLTLPMPVLIAVMKKHQRYFPVFVQGNEQTQENLLPYFITVANSAGSGPA